MTDSIVIFEQWNSDDLGLPGTSTNGQLQIIKPADTSKPIHQLFHADDGRSWKRRSVAGNDGAWKSWKKLFSQDEQPVLASDLYTVVGSNVLSDTNFNDTNNNYSTYWSVFSPAVVDTTSSDLLALSSIRNIKIATVAPGTGIKQGGLCLQTNDLFLDSGVSFYGYLNILGKAGTASEVDIVVTFLNAASVPIGASSQVVGTQIIGLSGTDQTFQLPFNFTTPVGTVYVIFGISVFAGGSTYGASSAYVSFARPRLFRIVPKAELTNAVTSVNGATGDVNVPSGSGTSSGTNTGDETLATIKTKLGITTLSGSNTGDETSASLAAKGAEMAANKDAASGYAGLDSNGLIAKTLKVLHVNIRTASATLVSTTANELELLKRTVAGGLNITLPTTPPDGWTVEIYDGKGDAATNNDTITAGGSDSIMGAATKLINTNYGGFRLTYSSSLALWIAR